MIKRIALATLAVLMVGVAGFYAVGGRPGVLLPYVKHVLRKDDGPAREITRQVGPAAAAGSGQRPPNVVLIVADDLAFNDITRYGGGIADGKVPTPHIDSIAHEGVDFRAGDARNTTCSPSRAAMMTGRYATRFGFEFTPTPKQFMQMIGQHTAWGAGVTVKESFDLRP